MSAEAFSMRAEEASDGSFKRQDSRFRQWVTADGSSDFAPEPGRYHLYVARACPWAHRAIIARKLMGLEQAIGISHVDPIRDDRGWHFSGGDYVDEVNGFSYLSEAYKATSPGFDERVSVPVLWDKRSGQIVNSESADVLRMLSTVFAPVAEHPVTLVPAALRGEIDELNQAIYEDVNNGVYASGFATGQRAYEVAVRALFERLDDLELRLGQRRFLFGAEPLETDWRLFTTLVRFDAVYQIHFKCSRRKLVEFPNLWGYARDLYARPGVADTVSFDEIRAHYYRTHPMLNPRQLVAVMPSADWHAPHGRAHLAA